jgi:hypothetical protein
MKVFIWPENDINSSNSSDIVSHHIFSTHDLPTLKKSAVDNVPDVFIPSFPPSSNFILSASSSFLDILKSPIHHHSYVSSSEPTSSTNIMGAVDTGCTTMILPLSIAQQFNLDIQPLLDPFITHFAEHGSFATISHGVSRSMEYVWNFIAVSDKISTILIDIKQPIRLGYSFIANNISASLILSQPPYSVVLTGPVHPNGLYTWDLQSVLDLKCISPPWDTNLKQDRLLKQFRRPFLDQQITSVNTLTHGARRYHSRRKDNSGFGYKSTKDNIIQPTHNQLLSNLFIPQQNKSSNIHFASQYYNDLNDMTDSDTVLVLDSSSAGMSLTSSMQVEFSDPISSFGDPANNSVVNNIDEKSFSLLDEEIDANLNDSVSDDIILAPILPIKKSRGTRISPNQIRYLNLLHISTGHLADSTMLDTFSAWHGLPTWLTKPVLESYLRSHHCLLCEIYRRRKQHPLGSGIPDQIPGYTMAFDFVPFTILTVFGCIGFYFFCCCATGAIKIFLVRDKSAESLIECIHQLETWLQRYGHVLKNLRSDAGSTENSDAVSRAISHISVDNSPAAPENQQANPAERQLQSFMQQVKIMLASSHNISPREWGLAVLATEYHYAGTMGSKAKFLSDGTMTRNQLITNHPYRVSFTPIPFGSIVTAPFVGTAAKISRPNNEVFRYLMPANPGSQADIVISLANKRPFHMMIRKNVRSLHLTSQLQLSTNLQNVEFTTNNSGELEITGMAEPTSVYTLEGVPDPDMANKPTLSIPSLSNTISTFRVNSAVPDSVQCYISEADEKLAMCSGPTTRSMTRELTPSSTTNDDIIKPSTTTLHSMEGTPVYEDDEIPVYWQLPPRSDEPHTHNDDSPAIDYNTDDEIAHVSAISLYEHAISASCSLSSDTSGVQHIPRISYDQLVSNVQSDKHENHLLDRLLMATEHQYTTNNYEILAIRGGSYVSVINPFPSRDYNYPTSLYVDPPTWHSSTDKILINPSNLLLDASIEISCLSFGKNIINTPELNARWSPVVQEEMAGYIGTCMFVATKEWFIAHPNWNLSQWICVLKEKRDATTGLSIKDKARFALDGSVEIRAGKHPDPSKYYCNTLGATAFKYMISNAAWKGWQISKSDSKQAFQHTPSTRLQPDVVWLPKEMSGAEVDQYYYITTSFQGLPESSRAWFDFTIGRNGFLQQPPCNMISNSANPCLLYWRGPPTIDPAEQGELQIGVTTDDNLETYPKNKASRDHLFIIRKAYADHGITLVSENQPNQIIGVAISYTDTSITLTSPSQIYDLKNIFFPNNEPIPPTWTPLSPTWSEESRNNSPTIHIDLHRSPVGIFLHLGNTRFDCANAISRHCSRTRQHTQLDWNDMRHHTAYLHTTRDIGVTYHLRRPEDPQQYLLTSTSDYGHSIYADGLGQLGHAIVGGCGFRSVSAPFIASSVKDSGLPAITTPDGELKSLISVTKTTLDAIVLATDSGNPQLAVPIEIDSQTVFLVAQDLSAKVQVFRHRRRQLSFLIACHLDHTIKSHLVPAPDMVADALTKNYGPLTHWRRIAFLLGESPRLIELRDIVFQKYSKSRNHPIVDIGLVTDDDDMSMDTSSPPANVVLSGYQPPLPQELLPSSPTISSQNHHFVSDVANTLAPILTTLNFPTGTSSLLPSLLYPAILSKAIINTGNISSHQNNLSSFSRRKRHKSGKGSQLRQAAKNQQFHSKNNN